jgi:hypothetical protein
MLVRPSCVLSGTDDFIRRDLSTKYVFSPTSVQLPKNMLFSRPGKQSERSLYIRKQLQIADS